MSPTFYGRGRQRSAPVFGAVCARCNHDFPTYAWPPRYDLCPECLCGIVQQRRRDNDFVLPIVLPAGNNWGMGS